MGGSLYIPSYRHALYMMHYAHILITFQIQPVLSPFNATLCMPTPKRHAYGLNSCTMSKVGIHRECTCLVQFRLIHGRNKKGLGNVASKSEEECLSCKLQCPDTNLLYAALANCSVVENIAGESIIHLNPVSMELCC